MGFSVYDVPKGDVTFGQVEAVEPGEPPEDPGVTPAERADIDHVKAAVATLDDATRQVVELVPAFRKSAVAEAEHSSSSAASNAASN